MTTEPRTDIPRANEAQDPPGWRAWTGVFLAAAFRPDARNILHWVSWALALGLEWYLVVLLWDGQIYDWEERTLRRIQSGWGHDLIFEVTSNLTNTLSVGFIAGLALAAIVLYVRHRRTIAMLLLLTFPLHVLAQFPKALIDRPRPSEEFSGIEGVGGTQSFPSGHSEYVVTFYGFIAYLLMKRFPNRTAQVIIFVLWLALALGTGYGRMAAGRHWPLDVLGSYAVGLGLLSGMVWIYRATARASKDSI